MSHALVFTDGSTMARCSGVKPFRKGRLTVHYGPFGGDGGRQAHKADEKDVEILHFADVRW